jgi:ATP-binding cassette subfamily B multidrug efflux pump
VALVGHTGSGKSTLASLLMGYYPLTKGKSVWMADRCPR